MNGEISRRFMISLKWSRGINIHVSKVSNRWLFHAGIANADWRVPSSILDGNLRFGAVLANSVSTTSAVMNGQLIGEFGFTNKTFCDVFIWNPVLWAS